MIDVKDLRENPDKYRRGAQLKNVTVDIDAILALADLGPVERSISLPLAWHVGGLLEAAHRLLGRTSEPRMTRFLAAQLGTSHYFDMRRARRDFGYEPKISTTEGMRRLGEALRQH